MFFAEQPIVENHEFTKDFKVLSRLQAALLMEPHFSLITRTLLSRVDLTSPSRDDTAYDFLSTLHTQNADSTCSHWTAGGLAAAGNRFNLE